MGPDQVHNLDDLNALYWQNRDRLGAEEQRLFQAILLELAKGTNCDRTLLEQYINRLGELRNLK